MAKLKIMTIFSVLIITLIVTPPVFASFFGDTVHTVRVYFPDDDFWPALFATHDTEEYIICDVIIDGRDTINNIGIRLKGNSSFGHPGFKKPFHLKFDEFVDSCEYRGNKRLTFNNGFKDPTFLREKLASEAFAGLGVPCPRVCWSVVYFNDEYWGFYTTVDPINKDALSRFFSENDGNLYKGDPNGTLEWLGATATPYRTRYEKSTNELEDDWSDLISLCDFINNTPDEVFPGIAAKLNVASFARMWAVNTFLVNLDSYQGTGHNYYLYYNSSNIANYIVWDINEAFGVFTFGMSGATMRTMAVDWHQTNRPLAQRLFDDMPSFRPLVERHIGELLATNLQITLFSERVNALADLIRPFVFADANKMFSNTDFDNNLENDLGGGPPPSPPAVPGLKSFVRDRGAYLASVIETYTPAVVFGAVLINELMASNGETYADEAGDFNDWFELFNPADTAVDLSGWWATDDLGSPRKWSFPAGTILDSRAYLIVWADDEPEEGPFHASFKLNTGAECLGIFASDELGAGLCDSASWTEMPRDSSYGRFPNGSGNWQICLVATPNSENLWTTVRDYNPLIPKEIEIFVTPNPFNSAVRIHIRSVGFSRVEIFDINGHFVDRLSHVSNESVTNAVFDNTDDYIYSYNNDIQEYRWTPRSDNPSGIYLVKAVDKQGSIAVKRIILMR